MARTSVSQTPGATSSQSGRGKVTASSLIQVSGTLTVCWFATHLATPRATPSIPSVAMNGMTFNRVIARPFTTPMSPPDATPSRTAVSGAVPLLTASAVTTPVSAMADPTDRSMPPLTMIIVIPIAPSATITVCATTMRKLRTERYWDGDSVISAKMTITSTRPRNGPSRASTCRRRAPAIAPCSASVTVVMSGNGLHVDRGVQHGFRGPLTGGPRGRQASAAHDCQPITESEQLGQVRADDEHRLALVGRAGNHLVDLRLAADVDAAGGFVEQQDVALLVHQPRERHLLLVA